MAQMPNPVLTTSMSPKQYLNTVPVMNRILSLFLFLSLSYLIIPPSIYYLLNSLTNYLRCVFLLDRESDQSLSFIYPYQLHSPRG